MAPLWNVYNPDRRLMGVCIAFSEEAAILKVSSWLGYSNINLWIAIRADR